MPSTKKETNEDLHQGLSLSLYLKNNLQHSPISGYLITNYYYNLFNQYICIVVGSVLGHVNVGCNNRVGVRSVNIQLCSCWYDFVIKLFLWFHHLFLLSLRECYYLVIHSKVVYSLHDFSTYLQSLIHIHTDCIW